MSATPFRFKQFTIHQDRCAMKVGTDGVLLGAWAVTAHRPGAILDIGAGTGLVALMLAQRSDAGLIDALEVDDDAFEQCVQNFEASPWNDRLFCYHAGWDEFVDEMDDTYDLIVSNPPFYSSEYTAEEENRARARSNFALPFDELISGVPKFLNPGGRFCMVAPYAEEANILNLAADQGLYPHRLLRVRGHAEAPLKRTFFDFSTVKLSTPQTGELIIEIGRHEYTDAYIALTKDFYLKM
ncbi:tRNA1(Val) (adenine(37)-N6)-methyltransferase [Robertkochia flava]|uniref:tRNA1(Val) (adenine(37)-N6)-methyltransferase n=1 Tax=Robertkochia flava TaxID=3447986 RepID=UPI001CC90F08|nr:methyltransferase [Robertkochia marina]